mmetsp:Transcript_20456/g.26518  ORF Transcript_20456/g.26518 Transcript_20456/m.26518 type:complete len:309 (+) Transcript_20456:57-983(+)
MFIRGSRLAVGPVSSSLRRLSKKNILKRICVSPYIGKMSFSTQSFDSEYEKFNEQIPKKYGNEGTRLITDEMDDEVDEEAQRALDALEVGEWYEAKVVKIIDYGAIVRLTACDTRGMIHLSELDVSYVRDARNVVHIGEILPVRLLSKQSLGKVAFSARPAGIPQVPKNAKAVAVFRLPFSWTTRKIQKVFSEEFGNVFHVDLRNKRDKDERVVTFIVFEDEEGAMNCIQKLPGNRLKLDPEDIQANSYDQDSGTQEDDFFDQELEMQRPVIDRTARLGVKLADDYMVEFLERSRARREKLLAEQSST